MATEFGDIFYDCRSDGDVDIEAAYPNDIEAIYPTDLASGFKTNVTAGDLSSRLMAGKHLSLKTGIQTTCPQAAAALFRDVEAAAIPRDIESAAVAGYHADATQLRVQDTRYLPRDINVPALHRGFRKFKPHNQPVIDDLQPSVKDVWKIRETVERVATGAHQWLHNVGGKCNICGGMKKEKNASSSYYPATLEISARVYSDKAPQRPSGLRNDPVTLKLPVELNPQSGQVKVNVFKPLSLGGEGDKRGPSPSPAVVRGAGHKGWGPAIASPKSFRHTQRSEAKLARGVRRVRWPDVSSVRGQFGELIFD